MSVPGVTATLWSRLPGRCCAWGVFRVDPTGGERNAAEVLESEAGTAVRAHQRRPGGARGAREKGRGDRRADREQGTGAGGGGQGAEPRFARRHLVGAAGRA